MTDGLWIAWTTLQVAHTAHSLDDEVGTFSAVKWVLFQLSRFRQNSPSGSVFDCQMGTFSLDKNSSYGVKLSSEGLSQTAQAV